MANSSKNIILASCMMLSANLMAADHQVTQFRYMGPIAMQAPVMVDSTDIYGKKFDASQLLDTPFSSSLLAGTKVKSSPSISASTDYAMHLLAFNVEAKSYAKCQVKIDGLKHYQLVVDGKKADGNDFVLIPGNHELTLKCVVAKGEKATPKVVISSDGADDAIAVNAQDTKLYTIQDVLLGKHISDAEMSYDGNYFITSYSTTFEGGKVIKNYTLRNTVTKKVVKTSDMRMMFVPGSTDYYFTRKEGDATQLVRGNVSTGEERTVACELPSEDFTIAPNGEFLILQIEKEGPKEDKEVYQISDPEDRQPGNRDRYTLAMYNVKTGVVQPLTYGQRNQRLLDISQDSRYVLFATSKSRFTERPTTLSSIYRLDLKTLKCDEIVKDDGFVASAKFSPDGQKIVVMGTPETFGGIGLNVPDGRIPSMYDYQLYILDTATKKVTAITRDFNPSIEDYQWVAADGKIWFSALDKDCVNLFSYDPQTVKMQKTDIPEDAVLSFSMAQGARKAVWCGEGASNSERLYTLDTNTGKSELVDDMNKALLDGISLGDCRPWTFVNSRGDSICCRYYLPPHFDASRKYPLIVNYYGGCSPTSRYFETRYPQHAYAAQGYVVLIVNPSGAAGFGQEFSSRHVNTAGKGVAEDIIEATKEFCKLNAFVNDKKVGCIGASYGGFMTQYLQTQTDIFAAAISHAGISDHTSYWGEGYWGYSYSEVSMANSYPWTRKDLYVDQSPLFNAEKIHTPLLFLHGNADTNVPIGESIQMFTALKLLGRPTAFVAVDGENHHILDYSKRIKWQNTIFAWFQKYLKDDSSWWDAMYDKVKTE